MSTEFAWKWAEDHIFKWTEYACFFRISVQMTAFTAAQMNCMNGPEFVLTEANRLGMNTITG